MAYITLEDLKAYLSIDRSTDDQLLTMCIERAQAIFEAPPPLGTGRKFEAYTATKHFGPEDVDGRSLYLWAEDLLTVTTLTNGDGVAIPADGFRLEPQDFTQKWEIRLLAAAGYSWTFTDADSTVAVAGSWGYSQTAPLIVQQAVTRLAAFIYKQKDTIDLDRVYQGDGVVSQSSRMPRDIYDVIVDLRRKVS